MTIPVRVAPVGQSTKHDRSDTAYRTLLRHSATCATCRTGLFCPSVAKLGRAWREARR